MLYNHCFVGSLLFLSVFLVGCSESPTAPPAPELSGQVELIDETGTAVASGEVVVRVRSSLGVVDSTTTDANGDWRIADLPAGSFTVEFEKLGFGAVQLADVQRDSSLGRLRLPERSSAVVTDVSAQVNDECGTIRCLSITAEVEAATFLPEGLGRRFFRGFLGTPGELSTEFFDQSFWFLVTDDDPNVRAEAGKALVTVETIRGLDLDAVDSVEGLALLLVGATENTNLINGEVMPQLSPLFPDIAQQGAQVIVEPSR